MFVSLNRDNSFVNQFCQNFRAIFFLNKFIRISFISLIACMYAQSKVLYFRWTEEMKSFPFVHLSRPIVLPNKQFQFGKNT